MAMFNSYVKLPEGTPIKKHQRSGCFTGPPSTHLLANFLRGPLAAIHEPIAPCSRRFFGSSRSRGRGGVDPMSYFTFDDFWKVTRLEIGVDHQNSASFQFPNFDDWKKVNLNGLHIDVCEKNTTGKTCKTIRKISIPIFYSILLYSFPLGHVNKQNYATKTLTTCTGQTNCLGWGTDVTDLVTWTLEPFWA